MLKFGSSTSVLPFFRTAIALFSRRKRDSQWIYSSKSEEMTHANPGLITISILPSHPFDSTLRLHRAIQKAHIILASNKTSAQQFLKKLGEKQIQEEMNDSSVSIYSENEGNVVKYKEQRQGSIDQSLQLSKQLEMAIETEKINQSFNDKENRQLKEQQQKLIQFMEMNDLRTEFQTYKNRNSGWPRVEPLSDHLSQMASWRKGGVEVLCLLEQFEPQGSKKIFRYMQSQKLPYQILPAPNSIINTLAASGFPADRFSLEYFPQNLQTLFTSRASMKMTIAVILKSQQVKRCFQEIIKSYGQSHMVYLQNTEGKMIGRGEIGEVMDILKEIQPKSIYRMAVAPFLSTFNQNLKEEKNKISQLQGEAYHEHTHFVRVQFLSEELTRLQQAKDPSKIQLYNLLEKMFQSKMPEEEIYTIASELSGASRQRIKELSRQVRQGMSIDYLGMAEMGHKK